MMISAEMGTSEDTKCPQDLWTISETIFLPQVVKMQDRYALGFLVGNEVVKGNLGKTEQKTVEFKILRDMRKSNNQIKLVDIITLETALNDKGVQEIWLAFNDSLRKAQELSIPVCKNSSTGSQLG
ncbi:hypothetical protein llap_21919 [Limosa lapponica baueri]|uniref:Rna-directed dna polymerase from mobile element jockey-like n=1 Tax=Limosa lapponica baueri TaxID=1758121 RepID=A0A2I0T1V2_LIMLA|nr:hypothetical protein llap_21919 [Limosa lapponica baueri]